jgi:hypothetical protein
VYIILLNTRFPLSHRPNGFTIHRPQSHTPITFSSHQSPSHSSAGFRIPKPPSEPAGRLPESPSFLSHVDRLHRSLSHTHTHTIVLPMPLSRFQPQIQLSAAVVLPSFQPIGLHVPQSSPLPADRFTITRPPFRPTIGFPSIVLSLTRQSAFPVNDLPPSLSLRPVIILRSAGLTSPSPSFHPSSAFTISRHPSH